MSKLSSIPLTTLAGDSATLNDYAGKVLLIVNVASECGFTKQYTGLEEAYAKYKDRGLTVLAFPSNDFGGQEPGTAAEIGSFCTSKFSVSFPMFDKVSVVGPEQHPLYAELIAAVPTPVSNGAGLRDTLAGYAAKNSLPAPNPQPGLLWNFEKFVIGRDGTVVARFESDITPDDARLTGVIETELAK